jgi:ankyrin repeat protein
MALQRRLDSGSADPVADAAEAARRGEFRLIVIGRFVALPPGVTCFTPYRGAPDFLVDYHQGDAPDERDARRFAYATAYNRALVDRPDYPDADLCRPAVQGEHGTAWSPNDLTQAARALGRPPQNLHEAARRGSAADVGRLLRSTAVDAVDPFAMTALAWAVARNNRGAIETLLRAGANPWHSGENSNWRSALFWAAALGRTDLFERFARLPGRRFERWSPIYLSAALSGGDPAIVARILAEPHEPPRAWTLAGPLPSAALLDAVLRDSPDLAGRLLRDALALEGRPDLVRLALSHGSDPNAQPPQLGQETPLGMVATGTYPSSLESVDLLLRAGADPNMFSFRDRPTWLPIRILKLDDRDDEFDRRALAILDRLIAAGGDINLPNVDGRPPAWVLFFPLHHSPRQMDASFVTPALLEKLVHRGLDLNAPWRGRRVLGSVERQAGRDSELALALRRLGARR